MPYQSDRQRRFFHSEGARKAGITPAMVREFDDASKGRDLPEKRGAAYGVPKIPATPKPPSLGAANTLGAKPAAGYRGVPPLGKPPQMHKPVADLGAMSASRSSDAAARGSSQKLNDPGVPAGN